MVSERLETAGVFGRKVFHVTQDALKDGPNTHGQPRKTAYSGPGLWVGQCEVTARDVPSQWHHHKDYDSLMFMLAGRTRVEWGVKAKRVLSLAPETTASSDDGSSTELRYSIHQKIAAMSSCDLATESLLKT